MFALLTGCQVQECTTFEQDKIEAIADGFYDGDTTQVIY